jgi:hypothetical protein
MLHTSSLKLCIALLWIPLCCAGASDLPSVLPSGNQTMKLSETFIDKPQTPVAITVKLLQVSQAQIMGQMKITDDQSLAIQQGRSGSQLRWTLPDDLAAGWYHLRFAGTSHYQVIADWLDENEPYVLHVSTPEKRQEKQQSFTYRIPDAPVKAVDDLPAPLLRPTLVQDWQSSQPMWLEPGMQFDLAVRRPLLVMGDVSLLPVASNQCVVMDVASQVPYNLFTTQHGKASFTFNLHNTGDAVFAGIIKQTLTDALDGSTQSRQQDISLQPDGRLTGESTWQPRYGAYRLTLDVCDPAGMLLDRQHRYFTYSPFVDPHQLPESWPIGFHFHPRQPSDQVMPIGAKWIRVWGGWESIEHTQGKYDWSQMDRIVEDAKKQGCLLLWVCHGVPIWSLPRSVRDKPRAFANYAPEDMDRIRPMLRAFWKRYALNGDSPVIRAVEIGNEPNAHPDGWTPQQYAAFAKAIYEETHVATRNVKLVGISMSGGLHLDFMEQSLKAGLTKDMDIASLHLYEIQNPVGTRSIAYKTQQFMAMLDKYHLKLPVWNTESGCPTDIRQDGVMLTQEQLNAQIMQNPSFDRTAPWRVGRSWRGASELLGTAWMIRAMYQQMTLGVEKNFLFQWHAGPHHHWVQDSEPGGNPMPKIKIVATAVMSQMLLDYGPKPDAVQPTLQCDDASSLAFGHRYTGPKGSMTVVYVHPRNLDAGSGDQVAALASGEDKQFENGDQQDSPWLRLKAPKPVKVHVPVNSPQVSIVDMFNRSSRTLTASEGYVVIEATDVPQYVIEPAGSR